MSDQEAPLTPCVQSRQSHHVLDLLKSADAALEIIHLDPASVRPLTLRDIAAVRHLLDRVETRVADIKHDLFGTQD